ncbi:hypothetical protein TNCV_4836721 [Trichonephila clavipes]|nr:hypothetical protein TNCV_4836721 [Trichonephila clavipes]
MTEVSGVTENVRALLQSQVWDPKPDLSRDRKTMTSGSDPPESALPLDVAEVITNRRPTLHGQINTALQQSKLDYSVSASDSLFTSLADLSGKIRLRHRS